MAITNLVQGNGAFLQIMNSAGDYVDYVCSESFTLEIDADKLETTTKGDGQFKNYTYQALEWNVTLSGVLKFENTADAFSGFDLLDSQQNFDQVKIQITFEDDDSNIRSFRGTAIIENGQLSASATDFVKDDFTLTGAGGYQFFDGTVPCATILSNITVSGANSSDGTVSITYDYSGSATKVQYQVDGGATGTAVIGTTITIPTLAIGQHTFTVVPVCPNGLAGDVIYSATFTCTHSLTCDLAVTEIDISGTGPTITATVTFNDDPTGASLKYQVNGGLFTTVTGLSSNPSTFTMNLAIGSGYVVNVIPICSNGVEGTGLTQTFNVTTGTVYSTIAWSYTVASSGNTFTITKNGTTVASASAISSSGSFSASPSDVLVATVASSVSGRKGTLTTTNSTTATQIDTRNYLGIAASSYSFSPASGDNYEIDSVITLPNTISGATSASNGSPNGSGTIVINSTATLNVSVFSTCGNGSFSLDVAGVGITIASVSSGVTNASDTESVTLSPGTYSFTTTFIGTCTGSGGFNFA